MSEAYRIKVVGKGEVEARLAKFGPSPGLSRVAGEAAAQAVRDHFVKLDSSRPNALGGRRTHFWGKAARSVTSSPTKDGAEVTVSHTGVRQRLYGGTIRAVNAKYLTVPARAEAHGRRARSFKNLKFVPFASGSRALVVTGGKRSKRAGLVMYWLVPSVTQAADPSVLPSEAQLQEAVSAAASEYLMQFQL